MDLEEALAASNESGIQFMGTELSLAHTFMDVAETTRVSEHRQKSREDAQEAYRSLLKYLPRLKLSVEQKLDFDQQVGILRERMLLAGIAL